MIMLAEESLILIHTEEFLEVRVEVRDVTVSTDKRQDLPVRVGAFPEIPRVPGDLNPAENLRTDRLNPG